MTDSAGTVIRSNDVATDDVVRRAQSGDVAAFESLYRTHSPAIYLLCRRMTHDEREARESLQDAFVRAWEPKENPFMTVVLTFADEAGKTRYTARVRHWSKADRDRHEQMGFQQGWGICADQLEALARAL